MVAIRHSDNFWKDFREACKVLRIDNLRCTTQEFTAASISYLAGRGGVSVFSDRHETSVGFFIKHHKFVGHCVTMTSTLEALVRATVIVDRAMRLDEEPLPKKDSPEPTDSP